jgi:pimeloyl-ACP methyl ester carboxylesterase
MSDESSSEGFLGEELTRRQLLERLGVGGAAVVLPNVLTAPGSVRAATTTGACYATGESCSLGIDPDVYRMPLTGEYIQTADRRICATKNWSACPPEAFDIGFLRGFWPSVPTASQQATESAAFFFITTHWGPPDAPAADLNDVKTPADFPGEVFSSLASRTTRLEFDVPKTDFHKLGWTPAHLPVSIPADPAPDTPLKLRGWYIKGDGVARSDEERAAPRAGEGRATRERPLVILSSGFPYSIAFDRRVGGIDVGRQIRKTATYLVAQGFDVLFFDKRGHGYSEGLLEGMGEDIFRALDLLEHGVTVEEGIPLSLSVITADGRRLSGEAAAAERLLGSRYTARTKPTVLRGFSYGSSQLQKAMAMNYSDLPVEYRFKRDESGAVVVDEARMPAGNRRYNFRGIVAISGFQGSLKYETAPYFLALDALASTIGHNGGVLKSTVYQSMDRWPAHLGLYATNDFETADGAVDVFNNRLRGLKKIKMVIGYHFGLASEEVDTYFAEQSARFAKQVTFKPAPVQNLQTTSYTREVCRAEPVIMDPDTQSITSVPSKAIRHANRRVDRFVSEWIARQ